MHHFALTKARPIALIATLLALCLGANALAQEENKNADMLPLKKRAPMQGEVSATSADKPKDVADQVREALGTKVLPNKKLTVVATGRGTPEAVRGASASMANPVVSNPSGAPVNPQLSREYLRARAAALAGSSEPMGAMATPARNDMAPAGWSYSGEFGPMNWARLSPAYSLCSSGRRQSPINIQDNQTLQGPAEAVQYSYKSSNGLVLNDGHTISVDVEGDNSITLRGTRYQLTQIQFHAPSEIQINYTHSAMAVHLMHRSDAGQWAVVVVQLNAGDANALIDKVWTYMPLDAMDSVRMPQGVLNVNEILPADQRYYQFLGSLSAPPCSEGVLWVVIKQPLTLSPAQLRLFTQQFPSNARPVQPLYGRPVREAM